jgi:LPS-assembly lipoprotein
MKQGCAVSTYLLGFMIAVMLSACGFHLRSAADTNLPFKTIYLGFPESSPLGTELRRNIRGGSNTEVLPTAKEAQASIVVLSETRDKSVLSLNNLGRVREYSLSYTLRFRVTDNKGQELLAPTEITLKRDINYDESQVLAKEGEEAMLYRDMQKDLVQQILRRLAAIKPLSPENGN